jgi:putative oxidoreductase
VFLFYGSQKMLGVFGGRGYVRTIEGFTASGIPPVFAHMAIVAEFFGALGVLAGCLTPIAAFGLACTMAVATFRNVAGMGGPIPLLTGSEDVDPNRVFFPLFLFFSSVALMVAGAGRFSIDARYFRMSRR